MAQVGRSNVRAETSRGARRRLAGRWPWLRVPIVFVVPLLMLVLGVRAVRADAPHVDTVLFASDVNASAEQFVGGAIDRAQSDGATALVIELDTFGGDLASMQAIREKELGSKIPLIVYVAPSGAHADSAGALLALAAPIIAMAPGTRIGSASPVSTSGQNLSTTEQAKVTNALTAQVRSDQTTFGRNVDQSLAMVTDASAYDATEAVADHIVNLPADSLSQLLAAVDGESVQLADGASVTLAVAGLPVQSLDPTVKDQFFALLYDPNVLFLLFIVAAICLYLELSHPGAIVPGTVGVIALVLFLLGAGSISPDWAGLALMILAIVLLAIDVRAPTHGVLTVGALISLVAGSLIFFNTGPIDQAISPWLIYGVTAAVGIIALVVLRYALYARQAKVDTGSDRLVGQLAVVVLALAPDGRVRVLGEDWAASLIATGAGDPAAAELVAAVGERVRIQSVEGLRLLVTREQA